MLPTHPHDDNFLTMLSFTRLCANTIVMLLILPACQTPEPAIPMRDINNPPSEPSTTNHTTEESLTVTDPMTGARCNQGLADTFTTTSPVKTGAINHPELSEISGLAASTRRNNTLWAINDSGNKPKLFALKHTGESLGSFTVDVENHDWEDLASAWINGESYLLIAEIGDNPRNKTQYAIHIVTEPILNNGTIPPLQPMHTLRFRYPNGAHDAESMAYANGWVYILTKELQINNKRQASQVYRIPLKLTDQNQILIAEKIADLAIPSFSIESSVIASLSGLDVSQPTAFDIDTQNHYAYVLTYRSVYRYKRDLDESWAQVLARPRKRIHTHSLSQAEALAVGANGVVWFTSEKRPAPVWALPGRQ